MIYSDDAGVAVVKASNDVSNALKKAADDGLKTALKGVNDFQNTKDKAYDDAAEVGMRALPGDIRHGVRHLSEGAKREILRNPVIASALLAVIKTTNPLLAAEIRSILNQSCDPAEVISQLSGSSQSGLEKIEKNVAALTTPFKKEGISGWISTGCRAEAVGTLVRDAQHSTDELWTIDVRLKAFAIEGITMPPDRFIRIEVERVGRAHGYCEQSNLVAGQTISFGGPVLIDSDGPFLEVHPINDLVL